MQCAIWVLELRPFGYEQLSPSFLRLPQHTQTLPVLCTPRKKGRSSISVLSFMEHPGEHEPPPEAGDLVQDVSQKPLSLGASRAGGCMLVPGAGVASALQAHASPLGLSSCSNRKGNALSFELCLFSRLVKTVKVPNNLSWFHRCTGGTGCCEARSS